MKLTKRQLKKLREKALQKVSNSVAKAMLTTHKNQFTEAVVQDKRHKPEKHKKKGIEDDML